MQIYVFLSTRPNCAYKIHKLSFSDGIKWDGKIALVGTSMADLGKRKTDKISDLSVMVAETGLEPATSGL